jgi:hypothetical protein
MCNLDEWDQGESVNDTCTYYCMYIGEIIITVTYNSIHTNINRKLFTIHFTSSMVKGLTDIILHPKLNEFNLHNETLHKGVMWKWFLSFLFNLDEKDTIVSVLLSLNKI